MLRFFVTLEGVEKNRRRGKAERRFAPVGASEQQFFYCVRVFLHFLGKDASKNAVFWGEMGQNGVKWGLGCKKNAKNAGKMHFVLALLHIVQYNKAVERRKGNSRKPPLAKH
jgi:hypothetical protein